MLFSLERNRCEIRQKFIVKEKNTVFLKKKLKNKYNKSSFFEIILIPLTQNQEIGCDSEIQKKSNFYFDLLSLC